MKQFDLKKLSPPLIICLAFMAIIINSCRKDNKTQPLPDPALNQAKTWYESTYPGAGNTRMLITQSTRPAAASSNFDFSQYIKPDWNHAKRYRRLGKDVIELPVDPSGKLYSAIKNQTTGKILNPKENSRNSFVLLNNGKNYQAYVMTLLADSAYAKSHPGWASANTYQKRDPEFSGLVLYFTPKGQYVSGYAFKNGQQVIPAGQNTTTSATTKGQLTRSFRLRTQVVTLYDCKAWYLLQYDQWGNLISETFLYYSDCVPELDGNTDPGDSPSGSVPPPPPCQSPSAPGSAFVNNHSLTRFTQPLPGGGDDGGMPPPLPCPIQTVTQPEVSSVNDITNSVTDPCLKAIIDNLTNNQTLQTDVTNILRNTFGTSDQINITFVDGNYTSDPAIGQADAGTNGPSYNNFVVKLNTPIIANASKEFLMETVMHEIFHAYLNANPTITPRLGQHAYMIQNYVNTEVQTMQKVFPNLSTHDAECLVLGGYGDLDPTTFNAAAASFGLTINDIANTNTSFKSGNSGTRC